MNGSRASVCKKNAAQRLLKEDTQKNDKSRGKNLKNYQKKLENRTTYARTQNMYCICFSN